MNMKENRIFNKKGFTLLELLIAVAIFGVISTITFSIINFVPELAKTESDQFSERTYVRRAVADITKTIQEADIVSETTMEFTMPDGKNVEYEFTGENVNKIVNGTPDRLMESIEEFTLTTADYRLFSVHIKTAVEEKQYDFKVERRRKAKTKIDAEISTISPTSIEFDKTAPENKEITVNLNGNTLEGLRSDTYELEQGSGKDYTFNGDKVILSAGYLSKLNPGTIRIYFNVSNGVDPELQVTIKETGPQIKIIGNSLADDIARMEYPGNLEIDPYDDKWVITVTNATVAEGINVDALDISGLPQGIDAVAAKVEGENKILVTLSGTTSTPVTVVKHVSIILKASSVNETSVGNSDPIKVFILPGNEIPSPERNLMYTHSINKSGRVMITGDVVIGRSWNYDINLNDRTDIYGYVYVEGKLNVNERFIVGTEDKPGKVFIEGSANFNSNATVNGDLYYSNELQQQNKLTVTGICEKRAVEIPPLNIPKLKEKQWYIGNGYTVINSYWPKVELVDNGKYYYEIDYYFDGPIKGLENVTIVGKGNIGFNDKFEGSGILFAPNGTITSSGSFTFTGMCISNSITINSGGTLVFKRYAELPFDESYQEKN